MRIALDAMGGDFAPAETVKGAVDAAAGNPNLEIILVGRQDKISRELKRYKNTKNISIFNATEVIETSEPPVQAIKQKKDSSINVAVSLVKEGKADAVVSAGNTGALMASALFGLGRISGIERPAIASKFPTKKGHALLLDMGANVDCKPKHLVQFAKMGSIYSKYVLHADDPKVGLLNIGEEPEKGNELTTSTYPLLKEAGINFIGMVESKEIFDGEVDIVVCDGFIGNLILKFGESTAGFFFDLIKEELSKHPVTKLAALFLLPAFKRIVKKVDYDEFGGAQLLGLSGVAVKAHGRAKAKAIKNSIRVAAESVEGRVVEYISKVEVS
ncbi:MAG: phosphate acyltransferase PlsX [bacterium]